jgi:hypothetical protein
MRPRSLAAAAAAAAVACCHIVGRAEAVCLVLWDPALCHDGNLTLFEQTDDESPACLDGSPYGVYFRPNASSTKWTVFLEGGGWCYDEKDCLERSKVSSATADAGQGSSKKWGPTSGCGCMNVRDDGTIDDTCNCLWLPYGDGASFSGYRREPWPVPGGGELTFRGIKNLYAGLDFAIAHGLSEASDFVLTGGSAGGLSTFIHADRVAARVAAVAPSATIRAAPFTGFFLDHANFKNQSSTGYTAKMEYIYKMQNLSFGEDGALTAGCEALHPDHPGLCFMSPHMAGLIKTPFFMFNSRFDAWQLANINQAGWKTQPEQQAVLQYGADFLADWQPVVPKSGRNGAFITTCICHGCNWTSFVLDGKNPYAHYADWVKGAAKGTAALHVDMRSPNGDGVMAGPHCAAFRPSQAADVTQSQLPPPISVTATAGAKALLTLRTAGFAGVTLDWWPPDGGCTNCGGGWRNASVTHINLQSARLRTLAAGQKRHFLRHFILKIIILPRQARDKHRENSKKKWRCA